MLHRETCHAQREEPGAIGTDCRECVRRVAPGIRFLDDGAVCHHLVVGRGRHDELTRCLVGGVIDERQPVAAEIGPVIREERALAVAVVPDAETLRGRALVGHDEAEPGALGPRRRQRHRQTPPVMGERRGRAVHEHARDRHALAVGTGSGGDEIEANLAHVWLLHPENRWRLRRQLCPSRPGEGQ